MAITITNAAAQAMCDALVDLVDGGTGNGQLVGYLADATTEVFTCVSSSATAFGGATLASPSVATAATINDDTSATGNASPVAVHKWETSAGTEIWRGSVGAGSGDLDMSSTTVGAGDTVSISSYTVSQPTS